jgi:hypothetical protein
MNRRATRARYIEDLSLSTDDEHINVLGKGSQRRESDFFRGRWHREYDKMTQCQILSNLSSTSFIFLSWALVP